MIFEFGMGEEVASRTVRADNYALSEHTKQVRDQEQARLTDRAFSEALRLLEKHRHTLDMLAHTLLEKETIMRAELEQLLADRARVRLLGQGRDAARLPLPEPTRSI